MEVIEGDVGLGNEVLRGHIFEDTPIESPALWIVGGFLKVSHADEQLPFSDGKLKDQTEFVVSFYIVNHLYDGSVVAACIVENHRVAVFDDGEPLPIGVHLCWETPKDGMPGIGQNTQGTR